MPYYESVPPEYVTIDAAAHAVDRRPRTIYDWIRLEQIRTYKRSNQPILVHIADIRRIDALRLQGRRRKPRLPKL